jgi:hypothetical protein
MKLSPEMQAKVLAAAIGVSPPTNLPPQPPAPTQATPSERRPKYRNTKTVADGITFDSKKEAGRWLLLKGRLASGEIATLRRQVRFRLVVNGVLVCRYVADFTYVEAGRLVVEDVKGLPTPVYKLKARLMRACHGIAIRET